MCRLGQGKTASVTHLRKNSDQIKHDAIRTVLDVKYENLYKQSQYKKYKDIELSILSFELPEGCKIAV